MRVLSMILFLVLGAPAFAATQCTFDRECLEDDACGETNYGAEIVAGDANTLSLITDAETLTGRMIASDDNLHYIFEAPSAAHLLTEYPDGAARYTIHMDGPFTITYHGTCKGTP